MSFRSRANWVVRWGGLAALGCIALGWVISGWWAPGFFHSSKRGLLAIGLQRGQMTCVVAAGNARALTGQNFGVSAPRISEIGYPAATWQWKPLSYHAASIAGLKHHFVELGAWVLFAGVLVPTAMLWRRHLRHSPQGHCRKCRYNLAGATGDVCPECGAERRA